MGFYHMIQILFARNSRKRRRILALANVVGVAYFGLMVSVTVYLGLWEIVPKAYANYPHLHFWNYSLICYLFINTVGSYINAYSTDCSVRTLLCVGGSEATAAVPCREDKGSMVHSMASMFPCAKCREMVPERSHHCMLCAVCILKRDHHCFFLASCIGYHNQRYFIIFTFYMFFSGFYGTIMLAKYLYLLYDVRFHNIISVVTLLPLCLQSWLTGYYYLGASDSDRFVTSHQIFLVSVFYGCLVGALVAGGYFYWHVSLALSGQTTYEARREITRFQRSRWENFVDVFGDHWLAVWFLPIRYEMPGNGIYRSNLRVIRSKRANKLNKFK